jgi:hypothetical protein
MGLPGLRFRSGNPDVMIPAHCFLSPENWHQILLYW